jgi:hypothetical protein
MIERFIESLQLTAVLGPLGLGHSMVSSVLSSRRRATNSARIRRQTL